jgi:hypothetical protein
MNIISLIIRLNTGLRTRLITRLVTSLKYLITVIIFIYCVPCSAQAVLIQQGECATHFESGTLNWTSGILTATGTAVPGKEDTYESLHKSALYNAEAQIIKILKQIRINNQFTVEDYALANPVIMTGLQQISKEALVSKQIYTSSMTVNITLNTSIFVAFLQLVLPQEIRQVPLIKPVTRQDSDIADKKKYTGLIIDAIGLGFEPVLGPVIINDHGQEVYSSAFISREYAVQQGVCKYVCNQDKAFRNPVAGTNPLFLKALRKEGKNNATLVISMADYDILEKIAERHTFLSECRLIIIVE